MGERRQVGEKFYLLQGTFVLATLAVALGQWAVILERTFAAAWQWYKFQGYGDPGYITVGGVSQLIFYFLSATSAWVGFTAPRMQASKSSLPIIKKIGNVSAVTLIVGMIFWAGMLMSPLVKFR